MCRRASHVWLLGLLLVSAGCEAVDRVRNRGVGVDTLAVVAPAAAAAGPLTLGMHAPGVLRPGLEGTVNVSVTNRGDTLAQAIRLELLLPAWMEPAPPRPGEREVTMAASAEEGIRISYRMDDPPLEPGETQTVGQRIRLPLNSPVAQGIEPWSPVIRARLLTSDGQPLAEVESEIALDTLPGRNRSLAAQGTRAPEERERLGPVRLGMTPAALRQAVAGARDTLWTREGVRERGLVVPLGRQGRTVALLSGDTVVRIEVRDTVSRTREGLGVGSRFQELRAAYGRPCADVRDDEVIVWFPDAPGISFALDAPVLANPAQARGSPDRIPASARVTRWWLRRGVDRCG